MTFQLGADLLDACVLAMLAKEDAYGYSLTQGIKEVVDISDSTLYPVLRRLTKNSFLETYDQAYEGRNRRYYTITNEGKNMLGEYKEAWTGYKTKIDTIFAGGVTVE